MPAMLAGHGEGCCLATSARSSGQLADQAAGVRQTL